MAITHKVMTEAQVSALASSVLAARLRGFGFRDVVVSEEEDVDGEPILRMRAKVQEEVPARVSIDALGALREALLNQGEERIVFFNTQTPDEEIFDHEEF